MKNFKQIKILVTHPVAEAFKAACLSAGQSVNKTLSDYIESIVQQKKRPKAAPALPMATRPQRRKSLKILLQLLCKLYDAECAYNENIPENLRSGDKFERSQQSIETLEEAINLLEEAF